MSLDSFPSPPQELRRNRSVLLWLTQLVDRVVVQGSAATTAALGLVFKAAAVTDASASSVSVSASDVTGTADATYSSTEQIMLNDTKTLVNEMKADVNQLVTDVNAIKDQLNAKLAADRTAGQQET